MDQYAVGDDLPRKLLESKDNFILLYDDSGNGFDDVVMTTAVFDAGRRSRNISEYLQSYLGSQYRNLAESVALTVVYCLIFTTGVIGNVCTGLIVWRRQYMRTSTNYYLCSLAISDELTLIIGMPTFFFKFKFHCLVDLHCCKHNRSTQVASCSTVHTTRDR